MEILANRMKNKKTLRRSRKRVDSSFRFRRHEEIGTAGAEEDSDFLQDCFVNTGDLALLRKIEDKRVIVLGRTGSGKTALFLELARKQEHTIALVPENLALSYISNSTILKFFDSLGVNLDPFFKLLWRHVITVEILTHHFSSGPAEGERSLTERLMRLFPGKSLRDKKAKEAIDYLSNWGENFWQETEYRVREITEKVENDLKGTVESTLKVGLAQLLSPA